MYDELIAELRQHHCDAKEDDTQEVCEECSYDVIIVDKSAPSGFASVCVCGLMNRAADAIEELSAYVRQIEELRKDGYYLQKTKMMTDGQATMTMPLPEPPKELVGTDMRGGIRRDDAGNVIDWGITGPPGDVGKTEEE